MPIQGIDHTMPSLTEWLDKINATGSEEFRVEDNTKRDRLEVLYQTTGLVYDRPERMTARDIVDQTTLFQDILQRKGEEKCALRLVPTKPELPKLRVRGKTLRENLIWFFEQKVDPDVYKVEVVPHSDETQYSAIFVINDHGVVGEIIPGFHWQLTQGIYEKSAPIFFSSDFSTWNFSSADPEAEQFAKDAVARLNISDPNIREKIQTDVGATFTDTNYLKGYFEFVVFPEIGILFVDYNRILGQTFAELQSVSQRSEDQLTGICANPGSAKGIVRIVTNPNTTNFNPGDVLVCSMTMVDYLPLMRIASAIITEQGSILSHAAIVSRELGKPCLIGVKNATAILKDGESVEVDATNGRLLQLSQVTPPPMTDEVFIRPSWDEYFMEIARAVAKRATCDRGRSGCVISRDKQILVTGYVGSAAGLPHCDEVGHQMKTVTHEDGHQSQHCVRTAHAEQNAIVQAAKLGIGINGSTLYCKMTPCAACGRIIINSGVKRVVCEKRYHAGSESEEMFRRVGLQLDYFDEQVEQYANQ